MEKENNKPIIIRMIVSSVILALGILLNNITAVPGIVYFLIMLTAYLVLSYDILFEAGENIIHGELLDEEFLMSIATVGAIGLKEYIEAFSVMLLYRIGEMFADAAVDKSRDSITELLDIRPDSASVKRNGTVITVKPEEVEAGETVVVKPGEKIPLDGVIISGETTVDASALTGESVPQNKGVNDEVFSGCINIQGHIEIKVTSTFACSTVSKILELVETSAEKKAVCEGIVTKFARVYTPVVVALAVLIAVVPSIVTKDWGTWVNRALLLLVISCPCALVISVPLAYYCGIGTASSKGILIKGSNYLEAVSKAKCVLFDKTGTLTKGDFEIVCVNPVSVEKQELVEMCAAIESKSNHPIAKAVLKAFGGDIQFDVSFIKEYAGKGMSGVFKGKKIICGNAKLLQSENIEFKEIQAAGTVIYVACDGRYCGSIVIGDTVKNSSINAVSSLKNLGVEKTVMLTGDSEAVAADVAGRLSIDEYYASLLPADKVRLCEEYIEKTDNGTVVFVGDGVNDAPVLSLSDVGVAMGALGSDAAIEAADIVLMNDDLEDLALAVTLAKKTQKKVKFNIAFSIAVKFIIMILGIAGFANMWLAVFADVGVTFIAVINSVHLLKKTKKNQENDSV
ncbi:MAG: cadmium-translocating P-type ATPase [Clostridiales bacterium]|nr:cadmium-translocating P-type ATPase [Clostridiales bacterium]